MFHLQLTNIETGKSKRIPINDILEYFFNPSKLHSKISPTNKWNTIDRYEQPKQLTKENMIPFSTANFGNKKIHPKEMEFKRLLAQIRDPMKRKQIEADANRWGLATSKWPYVYVQEYLLNANNPTKLPENQELVPQVLDLNNKQLDESFLRMFGGIIQKLMLRMFGQTTAPVNIRGTKSQIDVLQKTLASEKRYIDALNQYGPDSPHTFRNKAAVEQEVSKFERLTRNKMAVYEQEIINYGR